jgi:hypothetical protein
MRGERNAEVILPFLPGVLVTRIIADSQRDGLRLDGRR